MLLDRAGNRPALICPVLEIEVFLESDGRRRDGHRAVFTRQVSLQKLGR